jgi:hypothetical protein
MIKSQIPRRLRAVVRARESSLLILAALVGAISGIVVVTMAAGVDLLHTLAKVKSIVFDPNDSLLMSARSSLGIGPQIPNE